MLLIAADYCPFAGKRQCGPIRSHQSEDFALANVEIEFQEDGRQNQITS